jgi:hypothetical protein
VPTSWAIPGAEGAEGGFLMLVSSLDQINLGDEFPFIRSKGFSRRTELCDLMSSYGSDKGNPFHNYTVVYHWLFSRFRNEQLALFELGIGTNKVGAPSSMGAGGKPGASLHAWRAYFPHAQIYGADIDFDTLFEEERIQTSWTNQKDSHAIRALWDKLEGIAFDIMIDDGLHEASANIRFFLESFGKLKPGGIYVIEDITPHDADLLGEFAKCIARVSKSLVYEALDHPRNKVDNRLFIFQKA